MWKYKGTRIVKLSWKRQVKLDDLHCGFKTYYKSTLIKRVWNWHNNRHILKNRKQIQG